MRATVNRLVKLIAGWTLVFLGVIGWFLPVVPGTLFILLGLALLSAQPQWVRRALESLRLRFPHQAGKIEAFKEGLSSRIRKVWAP